MQRKLVLHILQASMELFQVLPSWPTFETRCVQTCDDIVVARPLLMLVDVLLCL
jgi:hypothetical protein